MIIYVYHFYDLTIEFSILNTHSRLQYKKQQQQQNIPLFYERI